MPTDCLFCKIAEGEIPVTFVYEDDQIVAFNDIEPQAPHHILIIPRQHICTTLDLTNDESSLVGHIYFVAGEIARQLGFADDGFRLVNNCNKAGGQVIWHLHFHLLAGRQMLWPPG
ncbi:histidine triad nucleotide-binding protein [Geopsychrobacter electrodiphilus]|uniref:histidine triad nucleotide-binding protein n=1 Tax=Geopsychrobacter electrodiphilus TaxID=225196 RepID=UPI000367FE38|nr:histidine triad nucleotide-binding protein [Geopsychrobacter electrodiphilus]